jgi:hypothetical protein
MGRVEVIVPAMEPDAISRDKGVDVFVLDSGYDVVLTGEPEAIEALLCEEWGDEQWAAETVASASPVAS